jgi:hypothetical protein
LLEIEDIGLVDDLDFRIHNIVFFVDYWNKMIDSNYLFVVVVVVHWNDKKKLVLHWNMVVSKYVDEVLFEKDIDIH